MNILLTGGLGYIGSHVAIALLSEGHKVVIYDNLSNSNISVLSAINSLAEKNADFVKGDILETDHLSSTMKSYGIETIFHFAGLKAVAESVSNPLLYFKNNISGTLSLLTAMSISKVNALVFSSSATVYGDPEFLPITEEHPLKSINPYGRTKLHAEEILSDIVNSQPDLKVVCLRYFNPIGAHKSGLVGEDPKNTPNNLMPLVVRAAVGITEKLFIYGDNYNTRDGTCERDFIHVEDVADGHVAALNWLSNASSHISYFNLGTGQSLSVLELISQFERVTGKQVPIEIVGRRPGDAPVCYADVSKAKKQLGWKSKRNVEEMCRSAWDFYYRNSVV